MSLKLSKPQQWLFQTKAQQLMWMGSRGSSKTFCAVVYAFWLAMEFPKYRVALFRKKYTEFSNVYDEIESAIEIFGEDSATLVKSQRVCNFPNGSSIRILAAETIDDVSAHQGKNFNLVVVDEAQNVIGDVLERIVAIARTTDIGYPARVLFTANPGGVGHRWLKEQFINPAEIRGMSGNIDGHTLPEEGCMGHWKFNLTQEIDGKDYTVSREVLKTNMFANPVLKIDEYIASLGVLSGDLKEMWIHGNWGIVEGQFIDNVLDGIRPVAPYQYDTYMRFIDPGYHCTAVIWACVDNAGEIKVFDSAEYRKVTIDEVAPLILARDREKNRPEFSYSLDVIDVAATQNRPESNRTVVQIFNDWGIYPVYRRSDRKHGWQLIRTLLNTGKLSIDPKCELLIDSLTTLETSDTDPEDCKKQDPDHLSDALRYGLIYAEMTGNVKPTKTEAEIRDMMKHRDTQEALRAAYS